MVGITRLVALLAWAGIGFLIFLLWRIARFYERSSSQRAHSFLFLPPLLLLPAGTVYYALVDPDFVGSPPADLLFFIGGALLALATFILGQIMMGER